MKSAVIGRHLPVSRFTRFRPSAKVSKALYFAAGTLGLYYIDTEFNACSFQRNFRTLWNGILITWDYKVNFKPGADINAIHQRTADRILSTCQQNGGLYVKFGQAPQYNETLRSLFMEAPQVPFDRVIRLFKEEFQAHPDEIFTDFERDPVASASIAQVHRAKLSDGTVVAVKVQKDYVRKQMFWDLLAYRIVLHVFEWAFELPLSWSADYTERHIREEVNFIQEGKNSERAAADFMAEPSLSNDIYVPVVHWEYTTNRILTTEWIEGVSLSKPHELKQAGFSLDDVMYKAISAFSFQIFQSGFVHSDPHIGNIIIRKSPKTSKTQVCILDHGLYMEERESFRQQYCEFWRYLFLLDMKALKEICSSWGIEDVNIFAQATLQRPYNPNKAVHLKDAISPNDVYRMQMVTKERIQRFLSDTEKIPKELIFVGRTLNIIRSNNKHLGSPVNRVNIMASWAVKGIGRDSRTQQELLIRNGGSKWTQTKGYWASKLNYFVFEAQLFLLSVSFYVTRSFQRFMQYVTGKQSWGFEDILDNQMASAMKEKLGIVINTDTFNA